MEPEPEVEPELEIEPEPEVKTANNDFDYEMDDDEPEALPIRGAPISSKPQILNKTDTVVSGSDYYMRLVCLVCYIFLGIIRVLLYLLL